MKFGYRVQVPLVHHCQQRLNCKISPLAFRNGSDFVIDIGCREIDISKFAVSRDDHLVNPSYSMISLSSVVPDIVELKEIPFIWVGGMASSYRSFRNCQSFEGIVHGAIRGHFADPTCICH